MIKSNLTSLSSTKIKKNIFGSLLSIIMYYVFDQLFSFETIIKLLGFKIINIFNISRFIDVPLDEYEERLGIIVVFALMYLVFSSLYDLFISNESNFRKNMHFNKKMSIGNKGIFIVFVLFLFKIFQVIIWLLIIISIGENKLILETPYLFVATVIGSFILSEILLSSATVFIFLSKLTLIKWRVL